jgi:hypothetical protein
MFKLLSKSIGMKLTIGLSGVLIVILAIITVMNVNYQNRTLFDGEKDTAKKLSDTVMTAIRYPMMTGDQDVIQKQFNEFAKLQGIVEIELTDEKGVIKRSTDKTEVNKKFDEVKTIKEKQENMDAAITKGKEFSDLEARMKGSGSQEVFTIIRPIPNEKMCQSCHGANLKYLGALRIVLDWTPIQDAMNSTRNRNILAFKEHAFRAGWCFDRRNHTFKRR